MTEFGSLRNRLFGIDVRSLAALRVGLGLALLADLISRAASLEAHYTDLGVLPRDVMSQNFALSDWFWSFHMATGTSLGQGILFAVAALAAVALVVGYRTRVATVVSWIFLVSLQARNPAVLYGADQLLRLLLFWAMFLPLGAVGSLDRRRGRISAVGGRQHHLSVASAGILLQVAIMYFFVGLQKDGVGWVSGDALVHALSAEMFAGPLAAPLLEPPALLEALTVVVPWFEMLVPLLLFVPVATGSFRRAGLMLLVGFHVMLALCIFAGLFPLVSIVALIPFLPSGFWDSPRWAPVGRLLESSGQRVSPGPERAVPRSAAAERIARWRHWPLQIFLGLVLVYIVVWNLAGIGIDAYTRENSMRWFREWRAQGGAGMPVSFRDYSVERRLDTFGVPGLLGAPGRILQIHQRWDMFSHSGPQIRGWPGVVATTSDGRVISLLEGGRALPPDADGGHVPPGVPTLDARWRIYFIFARYSATRPLRELFPEVAERTWAGDRPETLVGKPRRVFVRE